MIKYSELNNSNPLVIAELACGHEGSLEKFKMLVDLAHKLGCKNIKSQIFIPEERVTKTHPEWDLFNKVCLSPTNWKKASKYLDKKGINFFADIFGYEGLKIAKKLNIKGYKIHSEDFLNFHFIEDVIKLNKINLIGIGGAHRKEVYNLLSFLKNRKLNKKIFLMPGIQTFPTPLKYHSLYEIKNLIESYESDFDIKVGCADHISGDLDESVIFPIAALTAGASLIEKHLTYDRKMKWEDYESALDKKSFGKFFKLVNNFQNLNQKLGHPNKAEIDYRNHFKKTPVTTKQLNRNQIINKKDINYVKDFSLKTPLSSNNIIGKRTNIKLDKNYYLKLSDLKNNVGIILVARTSSERLKNKAIMKIDNLESISQLIIRLKRVKNCKNLILATSSHKSDDILIKIAKKYKIKYFRGSLENLSDRFYQAAIHFKLDHVVRVTGDDILRDEIMIEKGIDSHLNKSCDVTITANMPYGTQTEIFSIGTIKTIMERVEIKSNTEYLEWFLQNERNFSVNYLKSNYKFNNKIRLTLDYKEDLILFNKIFKYFRSINKMNFKLLDVLKLLNKDKKLIKINSHLNPKMKTVRNKDGGFVSDEINLNLKI